MDDLKVGTRVRVCNVGIGGEFGSGNKGGKCMCIKTGLIQFQKILNCLIGCMSIAFLVLKIITVIKTYTFSHIRFR